MSASAERPVASAFAPSVVAWALLVAPWLVPSDPRALAIRRVLLFWFEWPGFRIQDWTALLPYKSVVWHPVGILAALHVPYFSAPALTALAWVSSICSFCAVIGLFYRVTAPISAVLSIYSSWIYQSSGKVNHGGLLFLLVLLMFSFTRASDAWSVDSWIARRRGKPPASPSAEYRWPVCFIAVMVATMYGSAGLTKLMTTGLDWAFSDSFRLTLLSHHFTHRPPTPIGLWIASSAPWCKAVALMALAIECLSLPALLHRVTGRVVLGCLAAMQLGIWLMMGVYFREMVGVFLCLAPWDSLIGWTSARLSAARGN